MSWEVVIGLEIHVQLCTSTKIFCRCRNAFGAPPNTLICPVCLGYPGALPTLNRHAVNLGIRLALALGSEVRPISVFARKSYVYPDLPKGYQITQDAHPLALGGRLPLLRHDRAVRLARLHLEEDAGKLLHEPPAEAAGSFPEDVSLVDYNRCGVPLVEVVGAPEISTPAEAQDFVRSLRQVLLFTAVSDANLEEGSLRCDANISLHRAGDPELGTRVEIKNLNSVRYLGRALEHEIDRQTALLESGGEVVAETRTFDATCGVTHALRSKESAHDYRYFPEPDLPPLRLETARIDAIRRDLPEPPWKVRHRLMTTCGLDTEEAIALTATPELAAYLDAAVVAHPANPRGVANLVRTEVLRELATRRIPPADAVAPPRLAKLVALVDARQISPGAGKEILAAMWENDTAPDILAEELGLVRIDDPDQLRPWIEAALAEYPVQTAQYRAGKTELLAFFIGQVMRRSGGAADPSRARDLLRSRLDRTDEIPTEMTP